MYARVLSFRLRIFLIDFSEDDSRLSKPSRDNEARLVFDYFFDAKRPWKEDEITYNVWDSTVRSKLEIRSYSGRFARLEPLMIRPRGRG